jgi:hypothetical protein
MVAEVFAGFSAAKAAFDIAKGLKDLDDRTRRNAAVIELQEQILAAQMEQSAAIERIRDLEKQVTDFETWNTEKNRYELKNVGHSCFVRMLKPDARRAEPPHFVCTNCYEQRRISIIQYRYEQITAKASYYCPACHTEIRPSPEAFTDGRIRWIDDPGAN